MNCFECGRPSPLHLAHCPRVIGALEPHSLAAAMLAHLAVGQGHYDLDYATDPTQPRVLLGAVPAHQAPLVDIPSAWRRRPVLVRALSVGDALPELDIVVRHFAMEELRRKGFISLLMGTCADCGNGHLFYVMHWTTMDRWPRLSETEALTLIREGRLRR